MKANATAGFKSQTGKQQTNGGPAPTLEKNTNKTEEENYKEMEEEVHRLLEASATAKVKRDLNTGLQKAKDAAAKEKKIR